MNPYVTPSNEVVLWKVNRKLNFGVNPSAPDEPWLMRVPSPRPLLRGLFKSRLYTTCPLRVSVDVFVLASIPLSLFERFRIILRQARGPGQRSALQWALNTSWKIGRWLRTKTANIVPKRRPVVDGCEQKPLILYVSRALGLPAVALSTAGGTKWA